jgi:probable HAF family extracellular repeat protein
MVDLSGLLETPTSIGKSATVVDTSFDGSVLVGTRPDGMSYRWSEIDGFQSINVGGTGAMAVSADGTVVVGNGYVNQDDPGGAFRWTAATGAVHLDSLPGFAFSDATAVDVSADGNVIVGWSAGWQTPDGPVQTQAVRWVADGAGGFTVEGLGDLPGGNFLSGARAVSADGTVILGYSESDLGQEAFLWTASGGMQGLGAGSETLFAMSADGSVIVGGGIIWDTNNGVRNLRQVLTDLGVPGMDNWLGIGALGISADGRTLVGVGTNPQGYEEAWRVVLPENAFAPEFGSVPVGNYQVQAGQNISFSISATDADSPSQLVLYRLIGNVPAGVSLLSDGTFSWDPTTDDLGDYAFTIRAYDSGVPSRFTDATFTITVTL